MKKSSQCSSCCHSLAPLVLTSSLSLTPSVLNVDYKW
jgi:hypothetical protein